MTLKSEKPSIFGRARREAPRRGHALQRTERLRILYLFLPLVLTFTFPSQ